MPFSKKDCEKIIDIYKMLYERSNLIAEDIELACKVTIGDLIAQCNFNLVDARQFIHFVTLEKKRQERTGFNKLAESKKVFLIERDHMCRAAGLPEMGHDDTDTGVSFENTGSGEQAGMIKSNLQSIASKAQSLHDTIGDMDQLPEWVQEKIAVADEMIDTISDYLKYEYSKMRRKNHVD